MGTDVVRRGMFGAAAVAVALGAGAWLTAVPAAASGQAGSPVVTVKPSSGLADGQLVTVHGASFSAGAEVGIVECQGGAIGPSSCDLSTLRYAPTSATGTVDAKFVVSRMINVNGSSIDCAQPSACILGVGNTANYAEAAAAPLNFNPNLPLAPPLQMLAQVDPTGLVNPHTGVAIVGGGVVCNRPVIAQVSGELQQIYLRFIFTSYFSVQVICTPTSVGLWSARVLPSSGLFAPGHAKVVAQVSGFTTTLPFSGQIRLRAA
jgi:neocarzinostatin family protein